MSSGNVILTQVATECPLEPFRARGVSSRRRSDLYPVLACVRGFGGKDSATPTLLLPGFDNLCKTMIALLSNQFSLYTL